MVHDIGLFIGGFTSGVIFMLALLRHNKARGEE